MIKLKNIIDKKKIKKQILKERVNTEFYIEFDKNDRKNGKKGLDILRDLRHIRFEQAAWNSYEFYNREDAEEALEALRNANITIQDQNIDDM